MSGTRSPRRPMTMADLDHIPGSGEVKLDDLRRWPLSRVALYCADCGWARDYNPDAEARKFAERSM